MRYKPYDKTAIAARVKEHIKHGRNFRNPHLTLDMVADTLGIARSTLIKVFREEIGTTFNDYVNNCRLRHARHLVMLNKGRFTMEHIAAVAGYGTKQTFCKKYKDEYGETPSETDKRNIIKQ